MKRVGLAGLWHETNTYSTRRTSLADFQAFELVAGEDVVRRHAGTGTVVGGMLEAEEFEYVPMSSAGAWPSGPVTPEALDSLFELLETRLRAAGRLDGVLLNLHGAMVAEGLDDVELETVRRLRSLVAEVPIVVVLDLHANPSPEMVASCDAVIAYDTYPHVDMAERGREAAHLLSEIVRGRLFRTVIAKVPLLSSPLAQATDEPPMRDLKELASRLRSEPGVRRISLLPGFPYSDVARAGFSVVVAAAADEERAASDVASTLAAEVEARADQFGLSRDDPATAVERALAAPRRPVVLVDVADNVGGGAPGDGTVILHELLARRAKGAVVSLADAEAARAAAKVGRGGILETAVGGKTDDRHGSPVVVRGRVVRVTDGDYRANGSWMTGREFTMGTTAVVEVEGVTLVIMERALPPFHAEQLTSLGIEVKKAAVIVVKGAVAWRAAYGAIAATVIEADTPGICPLNPLVLPRTATPMRFDPRTARVSEAPR